MRAIIIGNSYSGKTTFFDAISGTKTNETAKFNSNIRNIKVYDERLIKIKNICEPKKFSPAEINVLDYYISLSEFTKNQSIFTRDLQDNILKSEVTIIVARAFSNEISTYFKEKVEPFNDFKNIIEEMCLLDLITTEKRLERLKKENKKDIEFEIMNKCYEHLQNSKPIFQLGLTEEDFSKLSGFKFLTQNKIMVVLNVSDDNFLNKEEEKKIIEYAKEEKIEILKINVDIENEISQMESEEDKKEFLKEYNLTEVICNRFVKKLFDLMGLISFFTAGKDEVKSWPILKDLKAVKSAGKIHSDIERGFIRAEIVESNVFIEFKGDMKKLKSESK